MRCMLGDFFCMAVSRTGGEHVENKKTDDMKFRSIFSALLLSGVLTVSARDFVHPGMSYTTADLDRMRQMIASRTEPY